MKQQPGTLENGGQSPDRFESDTQKIIHRHLAAKEDVITEEDIRNVRIGIMPPETKSEEPDSTKDANG